MALDPDALDRTFSAPILTTCALAGRLGAADQAWPLVAALPFELAARPRGWFRVLRLRVVSYALPALIAIGQVRHRFCPSRNPILRLVRWAARRRTLDRLGLIQPENGGFLDAAPLTSFVTMSLAAIDMRDYPVVVRSVRFLLSGVRPDGSWPIDTDLATWVTTLSVAALPAQRLDGEDRDRIRRWLLGLQNSDGGVPTFCRGWGKLPFDRSTRT